MTGISPMTPEARANVEQLATLLEAHKTRGHVYPPAMWPDRSEGWANDLRSLLSALDGARGVVEPFVHYVAMRDAKPLVGTGDSVHGIHFGTEWEAEITLSDFRRAAEWYASTAPGGK